MSPLVKTNDSSCISGSAVAWEPVHMCTGAEYHEAGLPGLHLWCALVIPHWINQFELSSNNSSVKLYSYKPMHQNQLILCLSLFLFDWTETKTGTGLTEIEHGMDVDRTGNIPAECGSWLSVEASPLSINCDYRSPSSANIIIIVVILCATVIQRKVTSSMFLLAARESATRGTTWT